MQQSPFSKACCSSADQDIPCILGKLEVPLRVRRGPPVVPVLIRKSSTHCQVLFAKDPFLILSITERLQFKA